MCFPVMFSWITSLLPLREEGKRLMTKSAANFARIR